MRALLLMLAACGDNLPAPATPLASDGTHLRDTAGRLALLRGVNARVGGVFDVQFADGRTPLEPIPPLTAADCTRMRALGFDLLRLPINWSALEPTAGAFDDAYLDRVADAVHCAGDAGMVVLVDLHQDAYSKEIGEDGAPLWAIQPPPTMLLGGPLDDLGDRRLSAQVGAAFATFFDPADPAGLQAAFEDALAHVAARFADDPAVLGFDLYNEPPVKEPDVDAFTQVAAARVHAVAPEKLVMFEPSAARNLLDSAPKAAAPFPVANAVYAPHVYTFVFFSDPSSLENLQPADLEPSVASARDEATAWHTPLVIGEYGVGPTTPNADLWMGVEAELHDRFLASDAFWLWKENSQGAWGVFDHADPDVWTERPQVVAWISRIHAARIAGDVVANAYDHTTGALRLEIARGTNNGRATDLYIPERSQTSFAVTCDDTAVATTRDPATGLVSLTCEGVIAVTP
jgi:endoglycosylceramidase